MENKQNKSEELVKKSALAEMEEKVLAFWDQDQTFAKSISEREGCRDYVFYDGPPFATGLPHYGHIMASVSKDLIPRYFTMRGFRVLRRWGWDCHGLPIENIAEKELKISGKKQIEEFGIDKFNEFCRSKVLTYASDWGKIVKRIGRFVDFENSYKTMDNSYIESIWWAFKNLYEKGYIYEGRKVLLYCPRCETPISNFEVAMDNSYKDVEDETLIIKFKLKTEKNTSILAWTTTPWTLIGNLALAVNSKLYYVKLTNKENTEKIILNKDLWQKNAEKYVDFVLEEEMLGEKLLGLEYEPLYNIPSSKKGYYVVDGGEEVSSQEGTGVVHLAMYGEFDYELVKKYDLPTITHLDLSGKLILGPKEWEGLWYKKINPLVITDLGERGLIFREEKHTHSYPFCHRCATPLYYAPIPAWFINVQKAKERMVKLNEKIHWEPDHLKFGRFLNSLQSAPDWNISRNRYWASSIPVWKCESCSEKEIIGSISELKEKAIDLEKKEMEIDLHKHSVDKIHLKCPKCLGKMTRVPEVLDCWVESASMPFAALHYPFSNKEFFQKNFPSQFVSEYIAQTRAWFYVMLVMSTMLFDDIPFENVVVTGTILAEDGTKMSKSKNNFPDPMKIVDKYGVDALRFYLMSTPVMQGESVSFSEKGVEEASRMVTMVYNIYNFYSLFASENNLEAVEKKSKNILDLWILSKLNLLIKEVTENLDGYLIVKAMRNFPTFINELSTWYVRRSRDRFKGDDLADKASALATLKEVLEKLCQLMAPVTPFFTEDIYKKLGKTKSIHLTDWPKFDSKLIDEKLISKMEVIKEAVEIAHSIRSEAKIKVRQPLSKLEILTPEKLEESYLDILASEINVKEVLVVSEIKEKTNWKVGENNGIKVALCLDLSEELLKEGKIRDLVREINEMRKKANLTISDLLLEVILGTKDELLISALSENKEEFLKQVLSKNLKLVKVEEILVEEIKNEDDLKLFKKF